MKEYLSADVAMSEATFDLREGIRMKNVRIRAIHPSQRLIFNARELQLRHRPASLLRSKLEFDQVELVEPVLFVSAEESGEKVMTNLREIFQAIRKPSEKMTRVPTLLIRRGRVALRYEREGKPSSELEVGRIDLALKAHPDRPDTFQVRGRIADDDFGDWTVQGQYDPKANYIRIAATSKQVELGAKLRRRLPPEGQKIWDVFAPAGLASFELFFLFDGKSLDPIRFKLYANVRDGQMTYEGFPYLSSGIAGELEFDHRGVRFTNLTADMGNLKAVGSGEFFGYGAEAGLNLILEATRLPVDQKLRDASSPREREAWERLSPSGLADAVIRLVRDRGPAKPLGIEVDGKVLSGDLTLRDFPYALRGLEGTFHYRDNSVFIDRLTARSDGEEVNLTGQIRNFGKEQGVNLLVEAKNISLDEDLRRALPAEAQDAWEELGLRGTVDVVARVLRSEGKDEPYQPDVTITSRGVRLALRDFPYELKNLEGRLFVREGTLEIERLFSREGETTVTISGTAKRLAHGSPFHIQILGEKVPLDGRLREALAEPERKRWDSLAPEGKVSFMCDVSRDDKGFIRPDIRVKWLDCSFLPEGFPTRITDVTGISR